MGAVDANRLLTSTSTTVIRTEAKAASENYLGNTKVVVGTTSSTGEKSLKTQSITSNLTIE